MSWEACAWVWEQNLPAVEKWVLMGLANYANQNSQAWPSFTTLSGCLGLSRRTVMRNVEKLVDRGVLIKIDRDGTSNLYRLAVQRGSDRESPLVSQSHQGSVTESLGVVSQSHPILLSSNLILTQERHTPPKAISKTEEAFGEFWKEYPKKIGKGAAEKAWSKIKPDKTLREKIVAAVREQRNCPQWKKENGQYIPHPATWLNQKRWEDEPKYEDKRGSFGGGFVG